MKHWLLFILIGLVLPGCREDDPDLPIPVEMTADAVGYYCQMDLLTHDGPKSQIHLAGMPAPIFFSQVRDALAYLHMPEQNHAVRAAFVQDMSDAQSWAQPGAWIAVEKAVYVFGSDQMGGMGAPEFVPFSTEAAATAFITQHGGTQTGFAEIKAQDVLNEAKAKPDDMDQSDIANRLRALAPADGTH